MVSDHWIHHNVIDCRLQNISYTNSLLGFESLGLPIIHSLSGNQHIPLPHNPDYAASVCPNAIPFLEYLHCSFLIKRVISLLQIYKHHEEERCINPASQLGQKLGPHDGRTCSQLGRLLPWSKSSNSILSRRQLFTIDERTLYKISNNTIPAWHSPASDLGIRTNMRSVNVLGITPSTQGASLTPISRTFPHDNSTASAGSGSSSGSVGRAWWCTHPFKYNAFNPVAPADLLVLSLPTALITAASLIAKGSICMGISSRSPTGTYGLCNWIYSSLRVLLMSSWEGAAGLGPASLYIGCGVWCYLYVQQYKVKRHWSGICSK